MNNGVAAARSALTKKLACPLLLTSRENILINASSSFLEIRWVFLATILSVYCEFRVRNVFELRGGLTSVVDLGYVLAGLRSMTLW